MNVLSLFDGISCGHVALDRAGIKTDKYYASEIDKNAIKVTQTNYPDTIQLGDIRMIDEKDLPAADILIGGSPCTNFSFSGKGNGMTTRDKVKILSLNDYLSYKSMGYSFEGQSYLFWEYVRILKAVRPKYFLLENVVMKKEWERVISETLGVEPVFINSSLVSAQIRKRLYWTNIPGVEAPKDKNIRLCDILENISFKEPAAIRGRNIDLKNATIVGRRLSEDGKRADYDYNIPIVQCLEVRGVSTDKSNCLTTVEKDNVLTPLPVGRHIDAYGLITGRRLPFRNYTRLEYERLQTLPEHYTDCVSENAAKKAIGNGWTVDVITHILSYIKDI